MTEKVKFFLGANSHKGFVSYFEQLQDLSYDLQLFLLKGGPGSGKSTLMKKTSRYLEGMGDEIIYIPCASDPDSLDCFIDLTRHIAMTDATSPHRQDPVYPGVNAHIIYTGDMWNTEALKKHKGNIIRLSREVSLCHREATSLIKAFFSLLEENYNRSLPYIRKKEVNYFCDELTEDISYSMSSRKINALLSAVSVGKTEFLSDTVEALADRIYILDDRWKGASDYIMNTVRERFLSRGADCINCPCSVLPERTDHLIIPSQRIALTQNNDFHSMTSGKGVLVCGLYERGMETDVMEKNLYYVKKLKEEAEKSVLKAKLIHDELEKYYSDAMDYSLMEDTFEKIKSHF